MYCNYSKDKFGNELTFIKPAWDTTLKPDQYGEDKSLSFHLNQIETLYKHLIDCGWSAQQARMILPSCLKTEVCMTGFAHDWKYLLDLRLFGKTGKAHPDMINLMEKLKATAEAAGIWEDIIMCQSKFDK